MAIKNYVVADMKQIRPGVKVEAIRSEDKLDWGVSVELDWKKADEEGMNMKNIVESFKGFVSKVARSTINLDILKTIPNSEWDRVAIALKEVAKKYNFFLWILIFMERVTNLKFLPTTN